MRIRKGSCKVADVTRLCAPLHCRRGQTRYKMVLHTSQCIFHSSFYAAPTYRSRLEICLVTRYKGQFLAPQVGLDISQSLKKQRTVQRILRFRRIWKWKARRNACVRWIPTWSLSSSIRRNDENDGFSSRILKFSNSTNKRYRIFFSRMLKMLVTMTGKKADKTSEQEAESHCALACRGH